MERSFGDLISVAVREGSAHARLSIRQLARASGVSAAQINRLRSGQGNPTRDTLVAIARALDRNPNLLFIVSGHLGGEEAREVLRRVFSDGAEHVEVWKFEGRDVELARRLVDDPATDAVALAELALEVFLGSESEENLWQDPFLGSVIEGEDAPLIRELLREWAYLTDRRKEKVVEYVREQAELARTESTRELREETPDYGKP